jgi:hypothetical protein
MYKPKQRNPRLQIIGKNQHSYVQLVQMSILIYRIQQVARRSLLESRNIYFFQIQHQIHPIRENQIHNND